MTSENFFERFRFFEKYVSGHIMDNNLEDLYTHSTKTLDFFRKFVSKRNIKFHFESLTIQKTVELVGYMEKLIFLHDIGKLNPFAQKYYNGKLEKSNKTEHSKLSLLLIFLLFHDKFLKLKDKNLSSKNRNEEDIFISYFLLLAHCITFHHTNLSKYSVVTQKNGIFSISIKKTLQDILSDKEEILKIIIEVNFLEWNTQEMIKVIGDFFNKDILTKIEKNNLFFNIKLFYSLLVLSDYYATYSFQSGKELDDIEINQIDEALLNILDSNFHKVDYNQNIKDIDRLDVLPLDQCKNLNNLRNNLLIQATKTLRKSLESNSSHKRIFTLNIPTGGGKTNISVKLALEILRKIKSVNRINWVFPYVNIIEQNYSVIKKTLFGDNKELSRDNISQIYYDSFELTNEEVIDYDNNTNEILEKYLNISFINNPINIISNVNFFDSFFKVKKNNRYKFANFVNSVVILDEIQSLNSDYINLFYSLLDDLSKNYNIYFIVMSATLPNPSTYVHNDISVELIENKKDYFHHPLFRRNKIAIIENTIINFEKLIGYVKEKILVSHRDRKKFLIVVNTVNTSIQLFNQIRMDSEFKTHNFKVFLMNSLIKKDDRKSIIDYIKESVRENIILISTQSIEAGVDLDFDIGFRDYGLIDSIEQVSGRVNRECNPEKSSESMLYLFNLNNESKIYTDDLRFKIVQKFGKDFFEILEQKDFDMYYRLYFDEIKKEFVAAIKSNYYHEISSLNFKKIHDSLNVIPEKRGIKLISNNIDTIEQTKFKEFLDKYNCKTIYDLFCLRVQKMELKYKPFIKFIDSIINKNLLEINFFKEEDKLMFRKFLNEKSYLLFELNDSTFIIDKAFYNKYIERYTVDQIEFTYFNVYRLLKEDYPNFVKEMDKAIIL